MNDTRMGHSDPQILLGYSLGSILIYRYRAKIYSYKAPRLRAPINLSEFTEFPNRKPNYTDNILERMLIMFTTFFIRTYQIIIMCSLLQQLGHDCCIFSR